jgi:type II secretory pathway pseudopilin PulG
MVTHPMPSPFKSQTRAAGFTYIGLLLAIAAMGIALSAASEIWHVAQKRDREAQLLFAGNEYRRALERFYFSTPGGTERYPRQLEDLLKDPRYPAVRRHLRRLYPDPVTGSTEWGLVKAGDLIVGVYSPSEQEPAKIAGFDFPDRAFEGKTKYSEWVFVPAVGRNAAAAQGNAAGAKPLAAKEATPAFPPGFDQMQPGVAKPKR